MRFISCLFIVILLAACKKDEPMPCPTPESLDTGALVLCEGLFQQNNSTISWIDFEAGSVNNAFFNAVANRSLGDTGNDMERYGGKIYIVVNASSTIEVMSAHDFTPISQIDMKLGAVSKQPRSIAFSGSNAYVTCYDGYVDVIDTATLSVVSRIPVGANPEGLAVQNNKLYVANSGGLNFPNVDTTLSVIDLNTHSELMRIPVGPNPGEVIADNFGDIYVVVRGDYGTIPSRMKRIDANLDAVVEEFFFDVVGVSPMNSSFLVYDEASVSVFDPSTESVSNSNFMDMSSVTTLYGVSYNPYNGKIYLSDAMNYTNTGYLRCYSANGTHELDFHVGLNPSKVVFYD